MVLIFTDSQDASLLQTLKALLFELPPKVENRPELLEAQAKILAQIATHSVEVHNIGNWIERLVAEPDLQSKVVRQCLGYFTKEFDAYPDEVQNQLRSIFQKVVRKPPYHQLWELRRVL